MSKKSSSKDALFVALRKGQADRVARLIEANRDDSEIHPDMEADSARNSILHRAARFGHVNVVKVSFAIECHKILRTSSY